MWLIKFLQYEIEQIERFMENVSCSEFYLKKVILFELCIIGWIELEVIDFANALLPTRRKKHIFSAYWPELDLVWLEKKSCFVDVLGINQ